MKIDDITQINIDYPEGISGQIVHSIEIHKSGELIYCKMYLSRNWLSRLLTSVGLNKLFSSSEKAKSIKNDGSIFNELIHNLNDEMLNSPSKNTFKTGNLKAEFLDRNQNRKTFSYWTQPEMYRGRTDIEKYFEGFIQIAYSSTIGLIQTK